MEAKRLVGSFSVDDINIQNARHPRMTRACEGSTQAVCQRIAGQSIGGHPEPYVPISDTSQGECYRPGLSVICVPRGSEGLARLGVIPYAVSSSYLAPSVS